MWIVLGNKHVQKKKLFIGNYKRYKKSIRKLFSIYRYKSWIILALVNILYLCML